MLWLIREKFEACSMEMAGVVAVSTAGRFEGIGGPCIAQRGTRRNALYVTRRVWDETSLST